MIHEKKVICELFNDYNSTLGQKLATEIHDPPNFVEDDAHQSNSFFLAPTNKFEVETIINSLKPRKAPGFDGLKSETLKQIKDVISQPIARIINFCMEKGIFPDQLKLGMVTPIYKSGDKSEIRNYRPITLISRIAKIFETVLKRQMIGFLDKYNIIHDNQYGFRRGRSTEDAIRELTAQIYEHLDKTIPSLVIFLDLSKAFDTVDHKKMIDKLWNCGFRGPVHNLLKSYLNNRQQFVKIDNAESGRRTVEYGVPQGTVLGPVLFQIYINSLLKMKSSGLVMSFADDTTIQYAADNWTDLELKVKNDFPNLQNWFKRNKLTLNLEKSKCIPFASYESGLPELKELQMDDNTRIPCVKNIKYLGVIIDCHLRWDHHVRFLVGKLRRLLHKFRILETYLKDRKYLKIIYYALVQSQISYGIIGWGGAYERHIRNLNVIQKWILKIIHNKKRTYPSDQLFQLSQVLDIRQLYVLKILTNVHASKIKLNKVDYLHNTRQKDQAYKTIRSNKRIGQRSASYLAPRIFAVVPSNLRYTINCSAFKKKVSEWLKDPENEGALKHILDGLIGWND